VEIPILRGFESDLHHPFGLGKLHKNPIRVKTRRETSWLKGRKLRLARGTALSPLSGLLEPGRGPSAKGSQMTAGGRGTCETTRASERRHEKPPDEKLLVSKGRIVSAGGDKLDLSVVAHRGELTRACTSKSVENPAEGPTPRI